MSQVKLQAARELIKEKRYAEAQALLCTLPGDETAQTWLRQLDFMTARPKRSRLPLLVVLVVVVLFAAGYLFLRARTEQSAAELRAHLRLADYCIEVNQALESDTDRLVEGCFNWLNLMGSTLDPVAQACDRRSPDLDAPFYACLGDEDVSPFLVP